MIENIRSEVKWGEVNMWFIFQNLLLGALVPSLAVLGQGIWGNCLAQQVHDSQHVQESFAMDTDVQGSFNTIQDVQERFATQEVISKTLTSIKTFNITQFQYNQSRFSS